MEGTTSRGIHYLIDDSGGPKDGLRTLVLVHGVGNSVRGWQRVVESFPPGFRLVRYDLRGHGRSGRPPGPYSLDDFVEDHLGVVEELGLGAHDLAGCSLGGLIAQAIALREPEGLERLILISSIAHRDRIARDAAFERLRNLRESGPSGSAQSSGERWFTDAFRSEHPEIVEERLEEYRQNDPATYAASYRVLAENDLGDELHRIDRPTLVMTGEFDIGSPPWMSHFIASRIAGARTVIMPGQKHQLLNERPAEVAKVIAEFLCEDEIEQPLTALGAP